MDDGAPVGVYQSAEVAQGGQVEHEPIALFDDGPEERRVAIVVFEL